MSRELVHAGHERLRDRRVVIRQIATDQLGDQLRFGWRKELAADLSRAGDICLQRRLRLDDGANRRRRRLWRAPMSRSVVAIELLLV